MVVETRKYGIRSVQTRWTAPLKSLMVTQTFRLLTSMVQIPSNVFFVWFCFFGLGPSSRGFMSGSSSDRQELQRLAQGHFSRIDARWHVLELESFQLEDRPSVSTHIPCFIFVIFVALLCSNQFARQTFVVNIIGEGHMVGHWKVLVHFH